MKDIYTKFAVDVLIPASTLAADNTPAAVDLLGYDAADIILSVGVGGITFDTSNKIEFKLTHSDDNSTYTAVADADIVKPSALDGGAVGSGGIIRSLTAAHAAGTVRHVGYVGGKRYLKLLADFTGTHGTGTPISAVVLKGHGQISPAV